MAGKKQFNVPNIGCNHAGMRPQCSIRASAHSAIERIKKTALYTNLLLRTKKHVLIEFTLKNKIPKTKNLLKLK
jgi:hypothetical protein